MDILESALKMEEDAKGYYERLAEVTAVPELQNIFTILAAAEQEHHMALLEMKGNADPQKARFHALQEAARIFKPLLAKRDLMAELMEDPDAYDQTVRREQEGVRFYEEMAAQADDDGARKILLLIADQERKHLNIVENIYSYIESPKKYLAWGEFDNLREY